MLIDTHTHINFHEFKDEVDEVAKRALDANIWFVNVGTTYKTSKKSVEIAERFEEGVYATVGIHPIHFIDDITESAVIEGHEYSFTTKRQTFDNKAFKELIERSSKVVAVGECGLDYYRLGDHSIHDVRKAQTEGFRQQIRLAKEMSLALVVHGRGQPDNPYAVYDEILDILEEEGVTRAVLHCFGGSLEQARRIVEMGYYIGVTGICTFKNADVLQQIVRTVPLEHLVIETDAPYLTPDPYRGKRNEPAYVQHVAAKVAELRGVDFDTIAEETTINARRLYII